MGTPERATKPNEQAEPARGPGFKYKAPDPSSASLVFGRVFPIELASEPQPLTPAQEQDLKAAVAASKADPFPGGEVPELFAPAERRT